MLTILGVKFSYETLGFFALFIASEVVGISKLKENSIGQLILTAARFFAPLRKEDERVEKIRDSFRQ